MGGIIDYSSLYAIPEELELKTAQFFAEKGKNIIFIRPSYIPDQHRPDIIMDGIEWEIKCPTGNSPRTMESKLRKAIKQSKNVIFDLRNSKMPEEQAVTILEKAFYRFSQLKRLYIIKSNNELICFPNND